MDLDITGLPSKCGLTGHDWSFPISPCIALLFLPSSALQVLSEQDWDTLLWNSYGKSQMSEAPHSFWKIQAQGNKEEKPHLSSPRQPTMPWQSTRRTAVKAARPLQAVWSWRLPHLGNTKVGGTGQPCVTWPAAPAPSWESDHFKGSLRRCHLENTWLPEWLLVNCETKWR